MHPLKLRATFKTPPKFWDQNMDPPKLRQKLGRTPLKTDDLGLF